MNAMNKLFHHLDAHRTDWLRTLVEGVLALVLAALLLAPYAARAQTPAAGTSIGNQASATYTDASNVSRTATSNTVSTIVQQVASLTLTATQSVTATPGSPRTFSHTITNTGNGNDSFKLLLRNQAGDSFDYSTFAVYRDADCNGIADDAVNISGTSISAAGIVGGIPVGPVAAGGQYCVVVQVVVPGTAANGDTGIVRLDAASEFTNTVNTNTTGFNTDTVTVTANAVIGVTKAIIGGSSGAAGSGPYTYQLTYTNTGNTTAPFVVINDQLPTGMNYRNAGTVTWSGGGVPDIADDGDDGVAGFQYCANQGSPTTLPCGTNRVAVRIPNLAPGASGTISFQVDVAAAAAPGVLNNTGRFCYNDGTGIPAATTVTTPAACTVGVAGNIGTTGQPSNTVPFTVLQTAVVVANGSQTNSTNGTGEPVTVAAAAQGSTASFNNVIWNRGNGADSFDITLSGSTFPAGTTFILYKSDGVTPLVDTNGNATPDTGNIPASNDPTCTPANGFVADAVNARCGYVVVLKATLPGSGTGGPFSVTKTATSRFNAAVSDTVIDTLTAITTSRVDLTNTAPTTVPTNNTATTGGQGSGFVDQASAPTSTVITTNSVNPGASTVFQLHVSNVSGVADSYDLTVFNALPPGWTASFFANGSGTCTTLGASITNTGTVNSGTTTLVCAQVSVPAASAAVPAPGQDVIFRVRSSATGAEDFKRDAVIVNTVRALSATPNNAANVFPSGSVNYQHILANGGNVLEGGACPSTGSASCVQLTAPMSGATAGWSNVIYWDRNNNGTLDATDPVISSLSQIGTGNPLGAGTYTDGTAATVAGLPAGKSIRLFVRVFAPGAAPGDINTSSLTATTTGTLNSVAAPATAIATDNTTIIVGQLQLVKDQAIDAACDGTPDGAYSQANITTGAVPGACIRYRITATNVGAATSTCVVISDATPANTTYSTGGGAAPAAISFTGTARASTTMTAPAAGVTGTIATSCTGGQAAGQCGASSGSVCASGNGFTLDPGQQATITFGVRINP